MPGDRSIIPGPTARSPGCALAWVAMGDDPHTSAIHGDAGVPDGVDLAPPIHVTSTYDRAEQQDLWYRRYQHPTTDRLEAVLGALEGGHAVVYPSGMAATAAVLRRLAPRRVGLPEDVYHGTRELVAAEYEGGTLEAGDVRWIETPSNPRCLITDIAAAVEEAHGDGLVTIVDSTFATPVLQTPLALGADFVMHSATKYIGGHSDTMLGVLVTGDPGVADELREARSRDGSIPGSLDAWLALRGVRTLPLRIERQSATALAVAEWLAGRVPRVWYPGLSGHPGHDVAARQMRAFGAIVSFDVGGFDEAAAVVAALRLVRVATSLGGVESLAEHRALVDESVPEGLIRMSVGLEAPEDLIADLDQALG